MVNNEYLDFDEAVAFLKTTPSTLYKWLQAEKIPAHKLGRQWRFLREELELHVSGKAPRIQIQKEALQLAELLQSRSKKEKTMSPNLQQLAENLVWDAFDHSSRLVHIYPTRGKYEISYRNKSGLEKLSSIQEELFLQLDESFQAVSTMIHGEDSRRMSFQRSEADVVQVRYQKLETVTGARITLRLWRPEEDVPDLSRIVGEASMKKAFEKWLQAESGIIAVTGLAGSGKTTTVLSLLKELKKQGRLVYTIEDCAEILIEGVNHVELKGRDPKKFEEVFEKIYASDPDVVCFGMGTSVGLEGPMYTATYQAASTGHLVILQMDSRSPDAAQEELKKYIPYDFRQYLVGISSQQLVQDGPNKKAHYAFLDAK